MKIKCEYCDGMINAEKDGKCPNCGASYLNNKEFLKHLEEEDQKRRQAQEFTNEIREKVMNQFKVNEKVSKVIFIIASIIILAVFILMISQIISIEF